MGYTLSIDLPNAPTQEKVLKHFKIIVNNEYFEENVHISKDPYEHGYPPDLKHGVFISFSYLDKVDNRCLNNIFLEFSKKFNAPLYHDKEKITDFSEINWHLKDFYTVGLFHKLWYTLFGKEEEKRLEKLKQIHEENNV